MERALIFRKDRERYQKELWRGRDNCLVVHTVSGDEILCEQEQERLSFRDFRCIYFFSELTRRNSSSHSHHELQTVPYLGT